MPLRNVPFGYGVWTTPPFAMNTLDVAVSAMLPRASHTRALSNPFSFASRITRALLGYRAPAFASVGMDSRVGRRKLDFVSEVPPGTGIGASNRERQNWVDSGSGAMVANPSASP